MISLFWIYTLRTISSMTFFDIDWDRCCSAVKLVWTFILKFFQESSSLCLHLICSCTLIQGTIDKRSIWLRSWTISHWTWRAIVLIIVYRWIKNLFCAIYHWKLFLCWVYHLRIWCYQIWFNTSLYSWMLVIIFNNINGCWRRTPTIWRLLWRSSCWASS